MNEHLTPWFNGAEHKPARKGVYMLMNGSRTKVGYQFWNGSKWKAWEETPELAFARRADVDAAVWFQNDNWRGLKEEA